MLRTDIGESAYLRTVPSDRINQILHDLRIEPDASLDPDTLRRVADFTSADRLLWGQYIKLGDQIRIDATLQDLKQQRNFALKAEAANEKELPKALQQLAESVEKSLALPPETIKELQAKSLKPSSQSVQALRYYAEGMQLARQGKNLDAVKQFEASTKEDPNFALAYSKLGGAYAALGYGDKAQEFSRKAVDLSDKVSPQEKYLIAAIHAQTSNDSQKAIQAYENLAKILPDDSDVQSALARLYEDARSADKARGFYNRLLARDKNDVDALLGIGRVELYNDNAQGSLDYFNRALALAVQLENDEAKGAALFHIGDAYWLLNKPNDALRNYRESLAIRRRLADKRGTGLTLQGMGVSQLSLGQWNQALKSYREALSLLREIGDKRNIALTLLNLGSLYENRGQYDDALSATKESLQIQREVGDPMNEAACLNNIGVFYEDKGDYENAVTYFQQALQLNEKLRNSTGTAEVLDSLGEAFSKMGQYDQAVNYYLRALDLFRKANDMRGVGVESYGLGTLSAYQGRFGAALSYEADALKDFRQIKEGGLWLAKAQASYGNALTLIGRGDEAQKSLDEALGLARELKSDPLIVQILNFQGDRFFYRGDFKSAKSLFEQAVQVATRSKDRGKVLISRANLAKLAVKERRFGQAITQLKGLAEDADKSGLKYNSLECSIYLAEALVYSRDYLRARQVLDRSLATSEKLTLRILLARGHYLLATLLSQTGQSGEAASRFAQTSQILDEVRKEAGDSVLKRSDLAPLHAESASSQVPKK